MLEGAVYAVATAVHLAVPGADGVARANGAERGMATTGIPSRRGGERECLEVRRLDVLLDGGPVAIRCDLKELVGEAV